VAGNTCSKAMHLSSCAQGIYQWACIFFLPLLPESDVIKAQAGCVLRCSVDKMVNAAQVSRVFSALLQLANNGNLVIMRGSSPSEPFDLQLASLDRPHNQFEDYRAPSFLQTKVQRLSYIPRCFSKVDFQSYSVTAD
jgi:hypothetical protein